MADQNIQKIIVKNMDLVKSMRDGNFDKEVSDDTSSVSPQNWFTHFSKLLARNVQSNSDSFYGKKH